MAATSRHWAKFAFGKNGDLVTNNPQPGLPTTSHLSQCESGKNPNQEQLVQTLAQLHQLLEDYAPTWYTQEHHEIAEAALQSLRK